MVGLRNRFWVVISKEECIMKINKKWKLVASLIAALSANAVMSKIVVKALDGATPSKTLQASSWLTTSNLATVR